MFYEARINLTNILELKNKSDLLILFVNSYFLKPTYNY